MTYPQYQVNLGYDPLLAGVNSPVDYVAQLDNLIVSPVQEYPDMFKGVTIGNGKIRIGLPGINKDIVLDANDIETFKQSLVK